MKRFLLNNKKITLMVTLMAFMVITLVVSFASPSYSNGDPKFTLQGSETYEYPYLGKERQIGAEKTTFLKHYYDSNSKLLYTEVIREADNSVLQKITSDGKTENYSVPAVSKENINKFNEKYDPEKIKKEMEEKKKRDDEAIQKQKEAADKSTSKTISSTPSTPSKPSTDDTNSNVTTKPSSPDNVSNTKAAITTKPITTTNPSTNTSKPSTTTTPVQSKPKTVQNYSIRNVSPSQDLMVFLAGETFRDVNVNNVTEKSLGDVNSQMMTIRNKLENENTSVKLIVTFMPYSCDDNPNGYIYHRRYENVYEILLFNNGNSFIDQFNTQFAQYKSEM